MNRKIGFLMVIALIFAMIVTPTALAEGNKSGSIKIGLMEDRSGNFAVAGIRKSHAAELAVKQINDKGGLLGRKVELVAPDMQSDMDKYTTLTRTLILKDKVDVLIGGFPSSAREAVRPIAHEYKKLYFYTTAYEGGVADTYTICVGLVPEQGFATLVPFMIQKYGKRVYTVAPDYVWGQLGTLWLEKYMKEAGGSSVGKEFIPLEVSDFSSTLDRIQSAKPDWIMLLLTGDAQMAYFKQRYARGINIPMADFVITIGQLGSHKILEPPLLDGFHETVSYVEDVPGARNAEFVTSYKKMFPKDDFITEEAEYEYLAVNLWAKAVKMAGTTDSDKVLNALRKGEDGKGMTLDAPEGVVRFDPTNNHLSHSVYLIKINKQHKIEFVNKWDNIEPFWLHGMVDLTKKEESTQYSPLDKGN